MGFTYKLLRDSMGGSFEKDYDLNFGRILANWRVYLKIFLSQLVIKKKSKAAINYFLSLRNSKAKNTSHLIQKTEKIYTTLVHQMLMHTMVMAGPIAVLRYFKTLNTYLENHITPGTRILKDLTPLFDLSKIIHASKTRF
ncbi:MAG: hypothetical protein CM1200mP16_11270 [Nitrospina sp.]|nr:MAG: hypothetical protein CM1200mP16_11270 [Nitrospina sp.]